MAERRTFADVLNDAGVDIVAEYESLRILFYTNYYSDGFHSICPQRVISEAFPRMDIRGTSISLKDFDRRHGFNFKEKLAEFVVIDDLILFCEYIENLLESYLELPENRSMYWSGWYWSGWPRELMNHIDMVMNRIGYEKENRGPYVIFVEKSPAARMVAEALPTETSYKVIEYNHHSMKGNLAGKRSTLIELANLLEPCRGTLKKLDCKLERRLFSSLNNFDIRHNNREQSSAYYKQAVDELSDDELECVYDTVYALCLTAFLYLENSNGLKAIGELQERL